MKNDILIFRASESWMYKSNEKTLKLKLFEAWISFSTLYPVLTLILSAFNESAALYKAIFLFLPICFTIYIKQISPNSKLLILLNEALLLFLAYMLSSSTTQKTFFIIFLIGYFTSINAKSKKKVQSYYSFNIFIISELIFAALFVISLFCDLYNMVSIITLSTFNISICYLLYFHIIRAKNLLTWEDKFATAFSAQIKKTMLVVCITIATFFGIIFLTLWQTGTLSALDSVDLTVKSYYTGTPKDSKPKTIKRATENKAASVKNNIKLAPSKSISLIEIIFLTGEVVFIIIAAVLSLILLTFILFSMIKYAKSKKLKIDNTLERRESLLPKLNLSEELSKRLNSLKNNILSNFEESNNKKIRNKYRKIILSYKNKSLKPLPHNTPKDIQVKLEEITKYDYQTITELYEKARYGQNECTDEDVKNMKTFS